VLEYCELFEDGFIRSKKLCIKAFLRRATSFIERYKFNKAKKDINEVLKLKEGEKNSLRMLKEIEIKIEHRKKTRLLMKEEDEA